MLNIRKSWDEIAPQYHKKYPIKTDTVHYGPLCPGENRLKLLKDLSGLSVIDLGCGAGQNAISIAKSGAVVTAVDFSLNQLIEAKILARQENVSIEFINSDMTGIPVLEDEIFDLCISACAMAFVHDLKSVLSEVYRLLKPGGRFVLSVMHPVQYIIDGKKNRMYFNSTYPFETRLIKYDWEIAGKLVAFQHYLRSISEYHNYLTGAGFAVDKILEPEPTLDTPHSGFSKEIMKEYPYIAKHLPITLIFSAIKPEQFQKEGTHG